MSGILKFKGEWVSGVTYSTDDIIWYDDSGTDKTYQAKRETTGDNPATSSDDWEYLYDGQHVYRAEDLGVSRVNVAVVAAGGGGGPNMSGGAGAGGLIWEESYDISELGATISVTVGKGGIGTNNPSLRGGSGGNSVFGDLTAVGGAGAGNMNGETGGSGSGSGGSSGAGTGGSGTESQGNGGGNGYQTGSRGGGGGGGAGEEGDNAVNQKAGDGGDGREIFGAYYAGGGGGSVDWNVTGDPGSGGKGGGGTGGKTGEGEDGEANTGGGGGGGGYNGSAQQKGGDGGSGIVLVQAVALTTVSGTVTLNGVEQAGAKVVVKIADDLEGTNMKIHEIVETDENGEWESDVPEGSFVFPVGYFEDEGTLYTGLADGYTVAEEPE